MKQIKLFMFLLFASLANSAFAQVVPIPAVAQQYVATYTWNGLFNQNWDDVRNWDTTLVKRVDLPLIPTPIPQKYPNLVATPLTTAQVNVVIPSGAPRYPNLRPVVNPVNNISTYTVSNLDIAAGASLNLQGQTLVVNGIISGGGNIVGGPTSSMTVAGHNGIGVYVNNASHDATYPAALPTYTETFSDIVSADLSGGPVPTVVAGTLFPLPNPANGITPITPYQLVARAQPGGLYGVASLANPLVFDRLSTKVERDPLVINFIDAVKGLNQNVYNVSADFSITDFDGTVMYVGKLIDTDNDEILPNGQPNLNPTPRQPVTYNAILITVTLNDGTNFEFQGDAAVTRIGFTSQKPIRSISISPLVACGPGAILVGYSTIDNIKIGQRVTSGTLNFAQTGTQNQLNNLIIDVATAGVGEVKLGSNLKVLGSVNPVSGVLNSTANAYLTLASTETGTASVASHTSAGSISGLVKVQRYFATGRNKQWRFVGFPYKTNLDVGSITGINSSFTVPSSTTIMTYLGAFNDGKYNGTSGGAKNAGYFSLNPGETIAPGDGAVAFIYDMIGDPATGTLSAGQTMETIGELNEDGLSVTKAVAYGPAPQVIADRGWNLISNPFASTIDLTSNAITLPAGVDPTIYRWDPQAANWTSYNITSGLPNGNPLNVPDQYIESGSSFFVKATANSNIVFNQGAKIGLPSTFNQFGKNNFSLGMTQQAVGTKVKTAISGLRLKASGPGNPIPAEAFIGLSMNDATSDFDNRYDAYSRGRNSGASVAIRSNNIDLAVQFDKPIIETGKEKRYYPLTVTVPSTGKTQLDLAVEGTWNSLNTVYLIDKKEGKTIPLAGNKLNYEFTMNTTKEEDRFVLAINHINVSEKSGITATDVRVMNNPVRSDVIDAIIAHPSAKAKSYSIVNGSGATLNRGSIQDNNSVQHQLGFGKSNANGVMYLRVDFENGDSKTVKFIKL